MSDEKTVLKVRVFRMSWLVPWMAGFMFTIGIYGDTSNWPAVFSESEAPELLIFLIKFLVWPAYLGSYFGS